MAACSYYRPTPFLGVPPRQLENSSCRQHSPSVIYKITAIFWRPKRTEPRVQNPSLGTCTLIGSGPENISSNERKPQEISLSVVSSISEIPSEDWDACAVGATGPEKFDPFITHAFLMSLEESGSAVKETGWLPQHVVAQDEYKNTIGVVPLYLKSHSNGEYVFDHSWADAYYRYGYQYYPKLQSCVPFTPVTGPRILVQNIWCRNQVFDMLVLALKDLTAKRSDSGVQDLAKLVVETKRIPDIIVNNAGTINKNNKIWEVSAEEFDMVMDTNIKGVANVLRHFLPLMIERKQGVIVNMSSGWGRSAAAEVAPYCASKWAIEGLTRAVAKELPPGLAIVALSPGVVNTDMLASCFGSSAALYQTPEAWAPQAATMILNLSVEDNAASLTV